MSKKHALIVSLLLVVAAIIIQILLKSFIVKLDKELVEFFSGILLGVGIGIPVYIFFGKKK
ncbi:MAG: hypothetical protein H6537_10200 [Bacteroidales bacterium]|nr:hypothetical protein [Bacteroidales bacterium]HRX31413.1 hypothetical protein [Tenuifilaceae bacterium]